MTAMIGEPVKPASTALLIGCGYLGRRLASRLLQQNVTVYGTSRNEAGAAQLARVGVRPMILEVTQKLTLASLRPALEAPQLDVYYMIPPARPGAVPTTRQVVIEGLENVLRALRSANIGRAVLTSTTAVYGQGENARVDADTEPSPANERGRMLLAAERLWLDAGPNFHVVRLAGLYGPGRIIGMSALREGAPIVGNAAAALNLIHVDDAAELLLAVATAPAPGRIELGCDDSPPSRLAYYRHLAERLGVPAPEVLDDAAAAVQLGLNLDRLKRSSSKICSNAITRQRTGWQPRFATFSQGLEQTLARTPER